MQPAVFTYSDICIYVYILFIVVYHDFDLNQWDTDVIIVYS